MFYRTSEIYTAQVRLINQASIEAVQLRIVDRVLGETIWEYALTAEDMERGLYQLSNFDLYAGEFMEKHWDQLMQGYEPDPALEVTYTFAADGGPETHTELLEASEELWISPRYDLKNPEDDFLHSFLEETTYPDSFVIRIDPTTYGELTMSYGEDVALQPGDVSVTVSVNGQMLSGEGAHMERTEVAYHDGTRYAYALVIPRPDSVPEEGTAEVTISRRLISYPANTRTDQRTIEYGKE